MVEYLKVLQQYENKTLNTIEMKLMNITDKCDRKSRKNINIFL